MDETDINLPNQLKNFLNQFLRIMGTLIIVTYTFPSIIFIIIPLAIGKLQCLKIIQKWSMLMYFSCFVGVENVFEYISHVKKISFSYNGNGQWPHKRNTFRCLNNSYLQDTKSNDGRVHEDHWWPSNFLLHGNGLGLLALSQTSIPHLRFHWGFELVYSVVSGYNGS